MERPLLSIIMPLYNKSAQVLESVRSAQAQTVKNWEMVVVDDGSTDEGPDLLRALGDERIRIVRQVNQGVSVARNRGVESARSDLIAFLDADDEWRPSFLDAMLGLAKDFPQAAWYASGYEIRHPREGKFGSRLRDVKRGFSRGLLERYFLVAMQSDPPVCASAVVVRRGALLSIGGFPEGIASGEDLLTWARLAVRFPLAYDTRALAVFHVSGHDRRPDPQGKVSTGLFELVRAHPDVVGLQAYLGLWCRMQAVMALRFNDTTLARRCAWQAVRNGPAQWRNTYTLMLAWMPRVLRIFLDGAARGLLQRMRNS